jgi:[acyl-carrier-protein] S-malonyltransferase
MLVILCPGQGSQKPGFMNSWLELPEYRTTLETMSESISLDLIKHGTLSDEDTIRDTAIAQPLIVATSIATANLLDLANVSGVAGHSVGEVAASQIAGIINQNQAMQLVNLRAQAMAKAAASSEKTGMAAILGGDVETVIARLTELGLTPANYNGAGQIVAAGSADAIQQLVAEGPEGSKVIPLSVAGAFHTSYMQPAVSELAQFVSTLSVNDPMKTLWSNQAGQVVTSGTEFLNLLVGQVANSVRWDLCMEAMVSAGVTAVIEVSPAGTLAGLAKRGMPGVEIVALKEPKDLETARELIGRTGDSK